MNTLQLCGAVGVIVLIVFAGVLAGRKIKSAEDFEFAGGKAGVSVVTGMIMGTMIGGSSTIGTAQLSYTYGLSAWWYTLGNGLGCLLIALFFVKAYRKSDSNTLIGSIRKEYGNRIGAAVSVLACIGMFINILAQLVAATAVLPTIIPGITMIPCLIITAALTLIYVVFGGSLGAGNVGMIKTALLCVTMIFSIIIVSSGSGLAVLYNNLDHSEYFNIFSRGMNTDIVNAFSMMVGIVSTQTYMQAVVTARTDSVAKTGTLMSALLCPIVGLGGVMIGQFMRVNVPDLANAKDALPQFALIYMPDIIGGIVMGTLLITLVGSSAGIILGVSTIIINDIIKPNTKMLNNPIKSIAFLRICMILLLVLGCILSMGPLGDTILNFSFMSMGFRGTVVFAPFMCATFLSGKVDARWVMVSVIIGPLLVLIFGICKILPVDSLILGMFASIMCCAIGYFVKKRKSVVL